MRHSRSYRVISEFHLCIFAVSLFHVSLPGKTEKSAKPITSRLCGYKKDHATDCLNKQFTLRGVFHMEVTTRFELVNEGFADLCLTTMIVVSPLFSELLRVSRMYLLHSTSTRLPTGISPPLGDIIIAHTPLSLQHSRILGRALLLGCSHFSFLHLSKPTILPTIL